jgi:uncharacterized protein (TIGR00290 family)
MRLAALVTGGKDSLYSVYLASKEYDIQKLVAMKDDPFIAVVRKQAAMMGAFLTETDNLEDTLSLMNVDGLITGSTASTQQKMDIDSICKRLGILYISPLWHRTAGEYVPEMLAEGFEMIFVSAQRPLDENWLGRKLDAQALAELVEFSKKYGINPAGEGGEYETIVTDCPLFVRGIELDAEPHWDDKERKGFLEILNVRLKK